MASRPSFGIGKGLAVRKFSRPLPPSTSLVLVALYLVASITSAGTVAERWVLNTGIL
ncbi:hypothetical protein D3C77_779250 [compost metagenome]